MPMTRVSNGLGVLGLVLVMAVTPLIPQATVSAQTYRNMADQEVIDWYCSNWPTKCQQEIKSMPTVLSDMGGGSGADSGGGCR